MSLAPTTALGYQLVTEGEGLRPLVELYHTKSQLNLSKTNSLLVC
jgi:hypothetical protein